MMIVPALLSAKFGMVSQSNEELLRSIALANAKPESYAAVAAVKPVPA